MLLYFKFYVELFLFLNGKVPLKSARGIALLNSHVLSVARLFILKSLLTLLFSLFFASSYALSFGVNVIFNIQKKEVR